MVRSEGEKRRRPPGSEPGGLGGGLRRWSYVVLVPRCRAGRLVFVVIAMNAESPAGMVALGAIRGLRTQRDRWYGNRGMPGPHVPNATNGVQRRGGRRRRQDAPDRPRGPGEASSSSSQSPFVSARHACSRERVPREPRRSSSRQGGFCHATEIERRRQCTHGVRDRSAPPEPAPPAARATQSGDEVRGNRHLVDNHRQTRLLRWSAPPTLDGHDRPRRRAARRPRRRTPRPARGRRSSIRSASPHLLQIALARAMSNSSSEKNRWVNVPFPSAQRA